MKSIKRKTQNPIPPNREGAPFMVLSNENDQGFYEDYHEYDLRYYALRIYRYRYQRYTDVDMHMYIYISISISISICIYVYIYMYVWTHRSTAPKGLSGQPRLRSNEFHPARRRLAAKSARGNDTSSQGTCFLYICIYIYMYMYVYMHKYG